MHTTPTPDLIVPGSVWRLCSRLALPDGRRFIAGMPTLACLMAPPEGVGGPIPPPWVLAAPVVAGTDLATWADLVPTDADWACRVTLAAAGRLPVAALAAVVGRFDLPDWASELARQAEQTDWALAESPPPEPGGQGAGLLPLDAGFRRRVREARQDWEWVMRYQRAWEGWNRRGRLYPFRPSIHPPTGVLAAAAPPTDPAVCRVDFDGQRASLALCPGPEAGWRLELDLAPPRQLRGVWLGGEPVSFRGESPVVVDVPPEVSPPFWFCLKLDTGSHLFWLQGFPPHPGR